MSPKTHGGTPAVILVHTTVHQLIATADTIPRQFGCCLLGALVLVHGLWCDDSNKSAYGDSVMHVIRFPKERNEDLGTFRIMHFEHAQTLVIAVRLRRCCCHNAFEMHDVLVRQILLFVSVSVIFVLQFSPAIKSKPSRMSKCIDNGFFVHGQFFVGETSRPTHISSRHVAGKKHTINDEAARN